MLSIGEFARLAGVSVRMLRHYDQLGLLRPQRVDPFSGYRSYAASQLDRANRLVALKDLGFTLEQVGVMLDDGMPDVSLAGLLRTRREELAAQIDADRQRLREVETRLRSIEKEHPMSAFIETPLPELHLVQLAAKVGVHPITMVRYETGAMGVRPDKVARLAKALGCTVADIAHVESA